MQPEMTNAGLSVAKAVIGIDETGAERIAGERGCAGQ